MIKAIVSGYVTSALLYERTHRAGFPELGRYALGGMLVLMCYGLLFPDDREGLHRTALAFMSAGLGVGIARIWGALV